MHILHNCMSDDSGASYCHQATCDETRPAEIFYAACIGTGARDWGLGAGLAADWTDDTDQARGGLENPRHPRSSAAKLPPSAVLCALSGDPVSRNRKVKPQRTLGIAEGRVSHTMER